MLAPGSRTAIWGVRVVDMRLLFTIVMRDVLFRYASNYLRFFSYNETEGWVVKDGGNEVGPGPGKRATAFDFRNSECSPLHGANNSEKRSSRTEGEMGKSTRRPSELVTTQNSLSHFLALQPGDEGILSRQSARSKQYPSWSAQAQELQKVLPVSKGQSPMAPTVGPALGPVMGQGERRERLLKSMSHSRRQQHPDLSCSSRTDPVGGLTVDVSPESFELDTQRSRGVSFASISPISEKSVGWGRGQRLSGESGKLGVSVPWTQSAGDTHHGAISAKSSEEAMASNGQRIDHPRSSSFDDVWMDCEKSPASNSLVADNCSQGNNRFFLVELVDPQLNFLDMTSHSSLLIVAGLSSLEGNTQPHATLSDVMDENDEYIPKRKNDIGLRLEGVRVHILYSLECHIAPSAESRSIRRIIIDPQVFIPPSLFDVIIVRVLIPQVSAFTVPTLSAGETEDVVHWKAMVTTSDVSLPRQGSHPASPRHLEITAPSAHLSIASFTSPRNANARHITPRRGSVSVTSNPHTHLSPEPASLKMAVKDFQIQSQYTYYSDLTAKEAQGLYLRDGIEKPVCVFVLNLPEICLDIVTSQFFIVMNVVRNLLLAAPPQLDEEVQQRRQATAHVGADVPKSREILRNPVRPSSLFLS